MKSAIKPTVKQVRSIPYPHNSHRYECCGQEFNGRDYIAHIEDQHLTIVGGKIYFATVIQPTSGRGAWHSLTRKPHNGNGAEERHV